MEKERDYYKLHRKAVEDLANADLDASDVTDEDLKRYRSKDGFFSKFPTPVKVVFLKFWFSGAICFFFIWGLGISITNVVDMLFVTSLAMGIVTDILVNNIFRFMEETDGQYNRWMMFPKKRFVSLFLNILYAMVLTLCVYEAYVFINLVIIKITQNDKILPLGVEPIMFGIFYMGFDMLFLAVKNGFKKILTDAKDKVQKGV